MSYSQRKEPLCLLKYFISFLKIKQNYDTKLHETNTEYLFPSTNIYLDQKDIDNLTIKMIL